MALEDYRETMEKCSHCGYCKYIPLSQVKSVRFSTGCPSLDYMGFHAYSGSGKLNVAEGLLDGTIDYSDKLLDVVNKCPVCGMCDVSCKMSVTELEPLETILELRAKCVEDGQVLPEHMAVIDNLREEDTMILDKKKADRGKWAEGLGVKDLSKGEEAEVLFHAGCRLSYDEDRWEVVRGAVNLLKNAGVDVGIMGADEMCCGGRTYEMGYRGEFTKYAESNIENWETKGIKTVVTCCSDGYYAFNYLYPAKSGKRVNVEVLHISQYLDRLIKEGKIRPTKNVPMTVTYHDPCHLGRMGDPYIPWAGKRKKIRNQIAIWDPPKPRRLGAKGVYEPPRDILKSIPGVKLVEMERIRECSYCCGAGGGVKEAYPDFAIWTASERIEEAKATDAEAIVTSCPWCERNFIDAIEEEGEKMKVYDVVELLQKAI